MHLHFLGAASTVTGSQFLLETGRADVLIDCGMFQGAPHDVLRNRLSFAYDPRQLEAVLLTHAHLDHSGLLPHLVASGYRGRIHATPATVALAGLVLLDSAKLQQEAAARRRRQGRKRAARTAERQRANDREIEDLVREARAADAPAQDRDPEVELCSQPAHVVTTIDAPLYTTEDARATLPLFTPARYGEELDVAPGVRATFFDAGHILGSAIVRLAVGDRVIVFSGDLGRTGTPIIRDPTVLQDADYVVLESTYGGRTHSSPAEAVGVLADAVRTVAHANGVLLIPAFAIGRTQELVWHLNRLVREGDVPALPLYLDSPMASQASDVYRQFPGDYDEETHAALAAHAAPLDYPNVHVVNDVEESEAIAKAPRPHVIIASNGMLTGGRVIEHFERIVDDDRAVLLFVGYQGAGTLGAHLLGGARTVNVDHRPQPVRCAVRSVDGFSAHADEPELLSWLGRFHADPAPTRMPLTQPPQSPSGERHWRWSPGDGARRPRRVFLVHGDPAARAALEPKVRALGFDTLAPRWRERVALD